IALFVGQNIIQAQELKVPAFTAYLDPNTQAARVGKDGITRWSSDDKVVWGGILSPGELRVIVVVGLAEGSSAKLKLTIGRQNRELEVKGAGDPIKVDFGTFQVASAGYQRIELAGVSRSGKTFGDIQELQLFGPAAKDAFFNLKPRRNAASVHLNYPVEKKA